MAKLFCFSIAGGSSEIFQCIEPFLLPEIQVIKLEYAGHGTRMREPFYADVDAMVEDMYAIIKGNLKETDEYMLFGYSMGSMVLSATLQQIINREELTLPNHIFLAAHVPDISNRTLSEEELENDKIVRDRIVQFGGVPEDIAGSAVFWKLYMPIYKADYRLMLSFDYNKLRLRTKIPATVFYCKDDNALADMLKWKRFYTGDVDYYQFEGGHFFIKKKPEGIAQILCKEEKSDSDVKRDHFYLE